MTRSRYSAIPLLLLAAVAQPAIAQSHPVPTDAADRPVRDSLGRPLVYATLPIADDVVNAPVELSHLKNVSALGKRKILGLKLLDSTPDYAEVWKTATFGAGIGATGIWSADLDSDGDNDLVLSSGSQSWSIVSFDEATGGYGIDWQSTTYTSPSISALRIVEAENTRRIWVGLSDGHVEVFDGATRELLDTLSTGGYAVYDFALSDADNDGATDILVVTAAQSYLFDPLSLTYIRTYPYGGLSVAVGNVDDDDANETVLSSGVVLEIDGASVVKEWSTSVFGVRIDLGDVDADGKAELVAADIWYTIRAWDLELQSLKWSIETDLNIGAMRLIDVAGDAAPEIVYGDGQWGSIHAIDAASRTEVWSVTNPEHGVTDIAVVDSDNDGTRELLWGAGWSSSGPDYLYVHDLDTLALEWQSVDQYGPYQAVGIGDVDADGEIELVVASYNSDSGYGDGLVSVFDAATHVLEWQSETDTFGGFAWTGVHDLALGNIDADPQLEIMVATDRLYDGALYVIDGLTHEMQNETFYDDGSPLNVVDAADLTGDGKPELVAGNTVEHTGSPGVFIYVLDPVTGSVVWQSAVIASGFSTITDVKAADVGEPGMDVLAANSTIHAVRWSDKRHLASVTSGYRSVAAGDVADALGLEILGGRDDGSIDVLDGETLAVVGGYDICAEAVSALETLPSRRILATCGNRLFVYDVDAAAIIAVSEAQTDSIGDNGSLATGAVNGRAIVLVGGTQAVAFADASGNRTPVLMPGSTTIHWRDAVDIQLTASDEDGDDLAFDLVSLPHLGSAVWLDRELGELRYTSGHVGTGVDSMTVRAADGFQYSAPAMFEVILENTAPAADTPVLELHWRGEQAVYLAASDPDGDPLSFALTAGPAQGTAVIDAATGVVTYTPSAAYIGEDAFSYTATDGADAVTEDVHVALTNTAPNAADREFDMTAGITVASRFQADDPNDDPLTYAVVSQPTQGEITFEAGTGLFEYVPAANGSGTDSVTFAVSDGIAEAKATVRFHYPPPAAVNTGGGGGGGGSAGWLLLLLAGFQVRARNGRTLG